MRASRKKLSRPSSGRARLTSSSTAIPVVRQTSWIESIHGGGDSVAAGDRLTAERWEQGLPLVVLCAGVRFCRGTWYMVYGTWRGRRGGAVVFVFVDGDACLLLLLLGGLLHAARLGCARFWWSTRYCFSR
ncbi:unnamed protein product [Ectocarpus fasciculatus]